MDRKIKVLIAEDMEPIRRKYVKIINASEDLEVVSDVESGEEAVKQAKYSAGQSGRANHHPDGI